MYAVAEFAQAVSRPVGPLIILGDDGSMCGYRPIQLAMERSRGRSDIEPMPAHAPEFMAAEFL